MSINLAGIMAASETLEGSLTVVHAEDGATRVPAGLDLSNAQFERSGDDLIINLETADSIVVLGYFNTILPGTLQGEDGIALPGPMVQTLAQAGGGLQFAQSGAAGTAGAEAIGKVASVNGTVTVQRADGTTDTLSDGDPVFRNDVIVTGDDGAIGITFTDSSVLSLSSGGRMTLDEYIYNPGSNESNMLVGLLQGTLSVVSGQIAPAGSMEVSTPVATMGIRGTSAVIQFDGINLRIALVTDVRDGQGGLIQVLDNSDGTVLLTLTVNEIGQIATLIAGSDQAELSQLTPAEQAIITQTVTTLTNDFNDAQSDPASGGSGGPQNGEPPEEGDSTPGSGINTEAGENEGGDQSGLGDGIVPTNGADVPGGQPAQIIIVNQTPAPQVDAPNAAVPKLTLPTGASVSEDGSTVLSGFNLSGSGVASVSITAQSTFVLASIAQLTFLTVDGQAVTPGTVIPASYAFESVTFTGSPSAVNAALNGMTYFPTPNDDDGGGLSFTVTANGQTITGSIVVAITPVNDAPVVVSGTESDYPGGAVALAIDPSISVSDVDSANLTGATVQITGNFQSGQDVLEFTDQNGITGNYVAATGVLTLSGTASVADYQTALQSVTYKNTAASANEAPRTFTIIASDGQDDSVPVTSAITFPDANNLLDGFETGLGNWNVLGPVTITQTTATQESSAAVLNTAGASANQSAVETFIGAASGALTGLGNGTVNEGTALATEFHAEAGTTILFDWRFATNDYLPFNDFAVVSFEGAAYELADVALLGNTSGNFSQTEWQTFSLNVTTSGVATLGFAVLNIGDGVVDTQLFIDNIRMADNALSGGAGSETLTGTTGADFISGFGGNDQLLGLSGNDELFGGTGDDTLTGGANADVLTGGDGSDVFAWGIGDTDATDTITDFDAGIDLIDLTGLLEAGLSASFDISDYVNAAFTDVAGNAVLQVDLTGSGDFSGSDLAIFANASLSGDSFINVIIDTATGAQQVNIDAL